MIYDGYVGVSSKDEVAVHRVDGEVGINRLLRGTEGLRNGSAAEDASRTRWMPHWAGVCEEIGVDIGQLGQLQDILDGGLRVVDRGRADEGCHGGGLGDLKESEYA